MNAKEKKELHDRVALLKDALEKGRIKVAPHLAVNFEKSLHKVKIGSDGLVVPDTVDGRIRSITLSLMAQKNRQELKDEIPLQEVQAVYFDILEQNFGGLYSRMLEKKTDANTVARALSENPQSRNEYAKSIPDFMDALTDFWKTTGDAIHFHLEDMDCLKAVFGGDLFPSYTKNIASTCGIYVDTIILPEPFIRSSYMFKVWEPKDQVYYVIKHALNTLKYKELALADITPPIVVILPDNWLTQEDYLPFIDQCARQDALKHAELLFNQKFDSVEDLEQFTTQFQTPEDIAKSLADPKRLLFDTNWKGSPNELISKFLESQGSFYIEHLGNNTGRAIFHQMVSRMSQVNDLLQRSDTLRGTPLIEAETSWRYFNWKLEYDAKTDENNRDDLIPLHIVRALEYSASNELSWLGNIPPNALIEIRKNGANQEIKEILSKGIADIITLNPENFYRSSDQIIDNINEAFEIHQRELRRLRDQKLKLWGIDVPSCLAVGGISVAAAILGNPILGALAAGAGMLGLPNLKDITANTKDINSDTQAVKQSPTGLLFKHAK